MAALKSSTMSCLGKATFRSFPQRLSAPVKDANYSTACRTLRRTISPTRPWTISQQTQFSPISNAIHIRKASTSASTTPSTNAAATQKAQAATLTWDEFLKLRRTRRYVNLVASIFAGIGSIAIATPLIAEYEIENIGAQMTGLDPMFVIGGSLMAVGGVGWLMGPFLGTAFFKVWKSSVAPEFARVSGFRSLTVSATAICQVIPPGMGLTRTTWTGS